MCSGDEVGLLKWKEKLSPLVLERDPPSNTAIRQHCIDHGAFFSSTIDQEVQDVMVTYLDKSSSLQIKILRSVFQCILYLTRACEFSYD